LISGILEIPPHFSLIFVCRPLPGCGTSDFHL
jgi:hypothetical protein